MNPIRDLGRVAPQTGAGALAIALLCARADAQLPATHLRLPQPGELNVLVIVIDDVGTDKLAMYAQDGGPPGVCALAQLDSVRTPHLDALRADGVLFTRCYVNPTCSPTRAALMTGRYGRRTGIGHAIQFPGTAEDSLPASEVTLAELVRDLNPAYRRGAFGKWHLTRIVGEDCHPADAGFELFEGLKGNPRDHYNWLKVTATGNALGCTGTASEMVPGEPGLAPDESFWDAGVTRSDAVSWIGGLGANPFFAYVAFSPPHAPWQVPPFSTLSPSTRARLTFAGYDAGDVARAGHSGDRGLMYHSAIEAIDYEIDQLLAGIAPAVLAKTMVFVIGDNGTPKEVINHHSLIEHAKRSLYELGTRAPLLAWGPLVPMSALGGTCRNLIGAVDVWRTVANVTGLANSAIDAHMAGTIVDSKSFLAAVQRPEIASARSFAYSETFANGDHMSTTNYWRGATDGSYRYIVHVDHERTAHERFFHTASDLCELDDLLSPLHPPLTAAETAVLQALRAAADEP